VNFDFSDDQKALKDQARAFFAAKSRPRAVLDHPETGADLTLWRDMADLGWLGASIPEAYGGLGLSRLETCVLAEEVGRALAPVPFSSTLYFFLEALMVAGDEAQKARLAPAIAAGTLIGCFALSEGPGAPRPDGIAARFENGALHGAKIPATDGGVATHAVVLARETPGLSLVIVELDQKGVARETLQTLDPSRGHARLVFDGAKAERIGASGAGWDLAEAVLDRAAAFIAFEQVGGAQACLDMAVEYAKSRYAFSRPIGSFQGIKHKLADMYVALELARSNAYFGAWALNADSGELGFAAAAARVAASEAFSFCAKENVQTHGGVGFTWDVDCHLFFRRAKLLALQAGAPSVWKEKLVRRLEQRNAA